MDIEALKVVVEVLSRGSFAEVARGRGVEPSWVSRTVAAVEAELGFRLFQRTTRRLSPTELGASYLAKVGALVADLEAARDEALAASVGATGLLRLTASVAFGARCILPLIPAFRALHPAVRLDLVFTDDTLDIVAEKIDLAVRLAPEVSGDLVCTRLMPTRYRVCAAPSWGDGDGLGGDLARLASARCLRLALPAFRDRWLVRDTTGTVTEVPVDGDLLFTSALTLYEAALMGLGPALLPLWLIADDLATGRLVDLLPEHDCAATQFDTSAWMLYPSRAYLPAKTRVAIDFLRERLAPLGVTGSARGDG